VTGFVTGILPLYVKICEQTDKTSQLLLQQGGDNPRNP
jgi:hypothetical protein